MEQQVLAKVAALPKMTTPELKKLWQEMFKEDAPRTHKTQLVKRLAYRLQELSYGVSPDIEVRIAEHAKSHFSAGGSAQKKKPSYPRPIVGTKIIREYKGIEHQVMVLDDGFEYQGCKYTSLSKIAQNITGAAWSGPAFFGLVRKKGGKT